MRLQRRNEMPRKSKENEELKDKKNTTETNTKTKT